MCALCAHNAQEGMKAAGNEGLCHTNIRERGDLGTLVIHEIYGLIKTTVIIIGSCYVSLDTYCDES